MCGIAGVIGERSEDITGMARMLGAMRHRGPDDEGTVSRPGALLGQRRLAIIDLAGGHQPLCNEDQTLWLVCNGEIYNYRELRRELLERGHRLTTRSDCEVILHLYEEMGPRCVERLRGMFAFALWDERRQRLFAARDRLGQKPFYYVPRERSLAFASEIKALLALEPGLAELDPQALAQYLSLRVIAPPRSMFRAIRKLPPGHWLEFSAERGVTVARYWDPRYEPKLEGTDEELTDALEERIIDTLRAHMVSDVPVGAFMSGGLDSTLLVAMLMEHVSSAPVRTFSLGLPYGRFDEAPYARLVAQRYGTAHQEQVVTPSLVEALPELVWHLDEPSDPLSVCTYLIARLASQQVKVVIGGDGGDELFGGYDRYYGNRYADYYARLPKGLRAYALGPLLGLVPEGGWYKSRGHQLKWLHKLSFLEGARRYARSLSYFYFDPDRQRTICGPALRDALAAFDPEAAICAPFDDVHALEPIDRMLYADSQIRLPDHSVMILDRMTMAHGLEARSPFMDHELAEFAARLPMRLKVRGRSLRYIQYQLAKRYLPRELLELPKQGFSSALPYMLRDEYRLLFDVFLRESVLARAGLLEQAGIDHLVTAHQAGKADHGNRLWLLVNSEVWYRMFVEGVTADELAMQLREAIGAPGLRQAGLRRRRVAESTAAPH